MTDTKPTRMEATILGKISKDAKQWTIIFGLIVAVCASIAGIYTVCGDWQAQAKAAKAAADAHDEEVRTKALEDENHKAEWQSVKDSLARHDKSIGNLQRGIAVVQNGTSEIRYNLTRLMNKQGLQWERLGPPKPSSSLDEDGDTDTAMAR